MERDQKLLWLSAKWNLYPDWTKLNSPHLWRHGLPSLPYFTMPPKVQATNNFFFVRDLMNAEKKDWNPNVIMNNFSESICRHILSIPISQQEQDTFVWAPSKLGAFSVRSSYRLNNKGRFDSMDDTTRKLWKGLWQSALHERHKLLVWKLIVDIIPTKERIQQFLS